MNIKGKTYIFILDKHKFQVTNIKIETPMKKNNIIALITTITLASLLLSCSRGEDNSFSPYYYVLKIRFEDKSGNDIVHGINTGNNKPENSTYEVSKDAYELDVTQTGKSKERLILAPLSVQTTDSYDCLIITTSTLPLPDYRPFQLTHKLVCPHIFSDEQEHTIVSNWKEAKPAGSLCTSIVVDGKTYSGTETDNEGYSILLVTFDD